MAGTQDALDSDELMHLAIADARAGRHDQAIERLKKLLADEPDNANAVFMLAAQHAEIGLYDRAVEGLQRALEIDPDLHTARFQLGLLLYTSGQVEPARTAWERLSGLDGRSALRLFPEALLHLADNEADHAVTCLETAIAEDQSNPALVRDMQKMLADLRRQMEVDAGERGADETAESADDAASKRIFLSNYERHSDDDSR